MVVKITQVPQAHGRYGPYTHLLFIISRIDITRVRGRGVGPQQQVCMTLRHERGAETWTEESQCLIQKGNRDVDECVGMDMASGEQLDESANALFYHYFKKE